MRNSWFFSMDLDGGSPYVVPTDPFSSPGLGIHIFSQITTFVDHSIHQSRYLYVPGSLAIQEAFSCISKFAGAFLFLFSSASNSNSNHNQNPYSSKPSPHINFSTNSFRVFHFNPKLKGECPNPTIFGKLLRSTFRHFYREVQPIQPSSVLYLAVALVPPFDNLSPKVLAVPLESSDIQVRGCVDQIPCEVGHRGCAALAFPDLNWTRKAIEPRTGIEFPTILDDIFAGDKKSNFTSEVLVGTGYRTMKIIKIKSLKVYAFGFYVHPFSLCEKLGPKYASVPVSELNKRREFYDDLLRSDISMTVRLVVNCNGMKIATVRDSFEKTLRRRLLKANPDTDYDCLTTFGSYFTQDIPLPVGTTIDFQRTSDGQFITKIGGNQIGAVDSKDLCRAFFDMYIGDLVVSEQAKEEIGRNVASIIRRC